jgi:cell shape-determining protein MreC
MKTNYLLKSKVPHPHRGKTILIAAAFFLLILAGFLFPMVLRSGSVFLARPVWAVRDVAGNSFGALSHFFSSKESIIAQNLSLEDEVTSLTLKEADYDILVKENEDLKAQLGRTASMARVMARVLSKPPRSPYDTLVIDAGTADGLQKGNKAYLSGNVILGLVSDVTPHSSVVKLFSTSGQKEESVLDRTGATYEIAGRGGANFSVDVPKDADILWGDSFTYPDLSPALMGTVYYIDTSSQSAFKTVYMRIPGNVFDSKWVFVQKAQ